MIAFAPVQSLVALTGAEHDAAFTAGIVAGMAFVHSFAYTSAEGALPLQRTLMRRGADLGAALAVYAIVRLWI